jgi:hypothetical protein
MARARPSSGCSAASAPPATTPANLALLDKGQPYKVKHPQGTPSPQPTTSAASSTGSTTTDDRVAPWAGTAHGVLEAVNTYEHHEGIHRGATRAECNMLRTVTGAFGDIDRKTWSTLAKVL